MNGMRSWKFWIGVLISVVFLWVALRGLSLAELLSVVGARGRGLFPGGVGTVLAVALLVKSCEVDFYAQVIPGGVHWIRW